MLALFYLQGGFNILSRNYEEVKQNLSEVGLSLLTPKEMYHGVATTYLTCKDNNGYYYRVIYNQVIRNNGGARKVHPSNPYSIQNINRYLNIEKIPFTCISNIYIGKKEPLSFQCLRCGEIVENTWDNITRSDNNNRRHVVCPKCDQRLESIHAIVLKQVFMHYYPDTVLEDKSCVNPNTGRIMPTDIVNHRLKIAIEIQSQWHDFPDAIKKGAIKRDFWVKKGYTFYAPDIRQYSILEMIQLFFDLDKIPDYIDYNFSKKLDIVKVQDLLNQGYSVKKIASLMDITTHRIYDHLGSGKLHYPDGYQNKCYSPILQYDKDWNFIAEYPTIKAAGIEIGCNPQKISSALFRGQSYTQGYNWKRKTA